MYAFDGFQHEPVHDGANGYVVKPTADILVKYTALQVFSFEAKSSISLADVRRLIDRGPYVDVEEACFPNGIRIIRIRMYGPYPVWDKIESLFETVGLELIELSTEFPGRDSAAPFFPFHTSFAAAYYSAPGVIIMTNGGDPLALPSDDSRYYTDADKHDIMKAVLVGVIYALKRGVILVDMKPDNIVFDGERARIIDTDTAVLAPDVQVNAYSSFRCCDAMDANNAVLACMIGLVIVAAVVHGAPYKNFIPKHHHGSKNICSLKSLSEECPEECNFLVPLLHTGVTVEDAETALAQGVIN